VQDGEIFERKLIEYGKSIIPKNAINTCEKHFG
jgi:negative regulator of genetic competence, sporulation and motility